MKNALLIFFLSISSTFYAQEAENQYYDTLFYTAGYSKPVRINYVENKKVYFTRTTKKGIVSKSSAAFSSLEYYVDYDEMGKTLLERNDLIVNTSDTSKFYFKTVVDTVMVPRSILSINPFSILGLGLSIDYMYRFGEKKQWAWHIPFRVLTLYGNTLIFQSGLGFKFIPFSSKRTSITMGASASFYFIEGGTFAGVPITLGAVRNISDLLTINVYGGVGPYISFDGDRFGAVVPEFHFGLGFKFGQYFETTYSHGVKVAK